jgi:hypothetical protein
MVLLAALIDSGVDFVWIISFGMKQKLNTFPIIDRDLLNQNATDHGSHPMNGMYPFPAVPGCYTLSNPYHHTHATLPSTHTLYWPPLTPIPE